jgi:hypothetical protein
MKAILTPWLLIGQETARDPMWSWTPGNESNPDSRAIKPVALYTMYCALFLTPVKSRERLFAMIYDYKGLEKSVLK